MFLDFAEDTAEKRSYEQMLDHVEKKYVKFEEKRKVNERVVSDSELDDDFDLLVREIGVGKKK